MATEKKQSQKKSGLKRRDFLKGLTAIPVFGGFIAAFIAKQEYDKVRKRDIFDELGIQMQNESPAINQSLKTGKQIRLGIIGIGNRGTSILESLGFKVPGETYSDILMDLNVLITGICDVYDTAAEKAIEMSRVNRYLKESSQLPKPKRFKYYQDMLKSKDVDAVIIATPDHWHANMVIDAAKEGKHIYCEKCLTRTIDEVYQVRDVIKDSSIVFQYGHQNRQQDSYRIARQIIDKNILGKITVVKTHTNRNTPRGAWVRHLNKKIEPDKIDWKQWLGSAPETELTPSRFYGWQKFFEYSGGLPPHMFSHEYDAINQVMNLGIPTSVMATGGIFYWKDDRNTPDVMQALFEYEDRGLMLTYDATLASSSTGEYESGAKVKEILGSDAWMKLGMDIYVVPDRHSKSYEKKLEQKMMSPSVPFLSYTPGGGIDAVTSASDQYYARQGLVYTYKGGKKVDVTYLHLKDWLNCIREGGEPSCNIDLAVEDALTCLMATKSYQEKRRVSWDAVQGIVT
jgi:predicted dehydrogenase